MGLRPRRSLRGRRRPSVAWARRRRPRLQCPTSPPGCRCFGPRPSPDKDAEEVVALDAKTGQELLEELYLLSHSVLQCHQHRPASDAVRGQGPHLHLWHHRRVDPLRDRRTGNRSGRPMPSSAQGRSAVPRALPARRWSSATASSWPSAARASAVRRLRCRQRRDVVEALDGPDQHRIAHRVSE